MTLLTKTLLNHEKELEVQQTLVANAPDVQEPRNSGTNDKTSENNRKQHKFTVSLA